MPQKKKKEPAVAPVTMEAVTSTLQKLHDLIKPKKGGERTKAGEELSNDALTKALDFLKSAVDNITKFIKKEEKEKELLTAQVRVNEDEVDAQKQKNLKGRFVINGLVKNDDQLKKENKKLRVHVKELAKLKYDVELPEEEITSCYHLKKGGIVIYLRNQSHDSGYQRLVNTIKSSKSKKDINIYFNFMLTWKRNGLLYDIRQWRKDGGISKYSTDENGNISIQFPDADRQDWTKVTNIFDEEKGGMITNTIEELKEKVE